MLRIRISLAAAIVVTAFTPALAELWPSGRDSVQPQARPFALQDVRLLDGPFRREERDLALAFRGSRNQRLIDLRRSAAAGTPVLWEVPW